jgi:deoxyribodipyrimidine photolyase
VPTSLLWFRRDLRLSDDPSLPAARDAERQVALARYGRVRAGA